MYAPTAKIQFTSATVTDVCTLISGSVTSFCTPGTGSLAREDESTADGLGRVITGSLLTDPTGADIVNTSYDSVGRAQCVENPYRGTAPPACGQSGFLGDSFTYDALNRPTSVTHADSNVAHAYYGGDVATNGGRSTLICASGNYYPTLSVDESGNKRQMWTDALGRTIEVDEPDPSSGSLTNSYANGTCYTYDSQNNLTSVTQGSQTRTYVFDGLSRLNSAATPESGTTHYCYTSSSGHCATPDAGSTLCSGDPSAVCKRTDARNIDTTYTYGDALNRLTGKSYSDSTPSVSYSYDASGCLGGASPCYNKGRRTGMSDGSGSSAWSYDAMGRVLTEQRTIGSATKTLAYAYNKDGSPASVTYPSGRVVTYSVNSVGQQVSAVDTANSINYALSATYAPHGAPTAYVNGQTGTFSGITFTGTYTNRLQPTWIEASTPGVWLQQLAYQWNANGTLFYEQTVPISTGRDWAYAYDALNRMTYAYTFLSSTGPNCWGQQFGYDRYSNLWWVTSTMTGCTAPTLSLSLSSTTNQITSTGFTYDAAGNMTADGNYSYTWDAEGRNTAAGSTSYIYDGDGARVKKSSGTLYWRELGGPVLAETDTSGNTTNEYVYFDGRMIARRNSSGNVYYYYQNALGTTAMITDSSANICYQADYYPFGGERVLTNTCAQNYKFTGDERDTETGNDHTDFRQYESTLGRWLSPDPLAGDISNPQSLNRYAYVLNNPASLTDPFGLQCVQDGTNPDGSPIWVDDGTDPPCGGGTSITVNGGSPPQIAPVDACAMAGDGGASCQQAIELAFPPGPLPGMGSGRGTGTATSAANNGQNTKRGSLLWPYVKCVATTTVTDAVLGGALTAGVGIIGSTAVAAVAGSSLGPEGTLAGAGLGFSIGVGAAPALFEGGAYVGGVTGILHGVLGCLVGGG